MQWAFLSFLHYREAQKQKSGFPQRGRNMQQTGLRYNAIVLRKQVVSHGKSPFVIISTQNTQNMVDKHCLQES